MVNDTATVIEIGGRYFYGFGMGGRVKTTHKLAGARLFIPEHTDITAVEQKLRAKGKMWWRVKVVIDPDDLPF